MAQKGPEITGVPDVTIETGRNEVVLLLGGPGRPEAIFQRKHRPDSQHAAGGIEHQSQVPDHVAVEHHDVATVGINRKKKKRCSNRDCGGYQDSRATIFPLEAREIHPRKQDGDDARGRDQKRPGPPPRVQANRSRSPRPRPGVQRCSSVETTKKSYLDVWQLRHHDRSFLGDARRRRSRAQNRILTGRADGIALNR